MVEKILLGVCPSTGNAYAKKFKGTAAKYNAYLAENDDLTPIPPELEGEDLCGLVYKDDAFSIDPEFAKAKRNATNRGRRRAEYPTVGDALDALAKWAFTETEIGLPAELKSWAATCMSIKAKYPIEED